MLAQLQLQLQLQIQNHGQTIRDDRRVCGTERISHIALCHTHSAWSSPQLYKNKREFFCFLIEKRKTKQKVLKIKINNSVLHTVHCGCVGFSHTRAIIAHSLFPRSEQTERKQTLYFSPVCKCVRVCEWRVRVPGRVATIFFIVDLIQLTSI